ncbi:TolC family protein [Puteibacter caeruleilacunae]|nr:TolC family protein [Puteibacter caeruleilacunae]
MSRLALWLGILLSMLLSSKLFGQNDPITLSVKDAQDYAMKNSYELREATIEINKARKDVWETIAGGLPQVEGTADYSKNLDLAVSLLPGEIVGEEKGTYVPVTFGQKYNSNFGFKVTQKIFDGSYIVGVQSAKIYLRLTTTTKEKTEIEVRDAVAQAYYAILVARANKKVQLDNMENTAKLLADTKAYYENGFREEQDVDQLDLMMKQSKNNLLQAEREIKISMAVLKYVLGMPMNQKLELSDDLLGLTNLILATSQEKNSFDPTNHIDYRLLESQLAANKKLLDLEKSKYLPQINAFYNWQKTAYGNKANLFNDDTPWFKSSMIGANASVNIWSFGQKRARINKAKLDVEKVRTQQEKERQNLEKEYLSAVANFETAVDKYLNDVDNRDLADKIYGKTKIKFNNGVTTSTELSQMEGQYLQAYGTYIGSTLELLQARVRLDKILSKL